jgi:hypothetical protein
MPKPFVFFLLLPFCGAVFGQAIEPGEWEFNAVTSSPLFPKGQSSVFRRCITREDAENPERWMARQNETGACQLTPLERSADSMKWSVACPKTNLHGTGIARRIAPGRIESEIALASELRGYRIEMNTRASGRRLGPCRR